MEMFKIKSYVQMSATVALMGVLLSLNGAEAPARFEVSEFEFERPEKWAWKKPSSSMRKAELAVPGKEGGESGGTTGHTAISRKSKR